MEKQSNINIGIAPYKPPTTPPKAPSIKPQAVDISSNPIMNNEIMIDEFDDIVYIDNRERARANIMHKIFPKSEITTLEVGDVVCGKVCVELKLPPDFISSIKERLKKQPMQMQYAYEHNFIIVIGSMSQVYSEGANHGIPMDRLLGLTASLEIRRNIHIREFSNLHEACIFMGKIFKKGNDGKEPDYVNPMKKSASTEDIQLNVLTAYPKISITKARAILEHFGSLETFFKADVKELKKVDGIGKTIAQKIYDINNLKNGEIIDE